jgi:gliding motility-associated lipoprotein GldJ
MRKYKFWIFNLFAISALFVVSCSTEYETSNITGWDYNNPKNGGFQKVPYAEQETGPGLILIEGGTFTMGRVEQDITMENHNIPRRVTVSSFYMDETEITNYNWCEYLYWINRTYTDFPMIYKKALPDTLAWREKMGNNRLMSNITLDTQLTETTQLLEFLGIKQMILQHGELTVLMSMS